MKRTWAALLAALLGLAGAAGWAVAGERATSSRRSITATGMKGRSARAPHAGRRLRQRHRSPGPGGLTSDLSQLQIFGRAEGAGQGALVVVTVLMIRGEGEARHVALTVGADPAQMRFLGSRPTGRGGLIVRESSQTPGVISVYRSSLAGGFDPVETIVELEFEALATGDFPLALTDTRVFDGYGADLGSTILAGEVHLE